MNKLAQQMAVARACGWRRNDEILGCWDDPGKFVHANLPDYLNDLNVMREALKTIRDWPKYVKMLAKVIAGCPGATRARGTRVSCATSVLLMATAAQQAEAYLRVNDLWED